MGVGAASSLMAFANIYEWQGAALTGYIRNGAITKVDRKASCHQHGFVETQPSEGVTQPSCRDDCRNWRSWGGGLSFEPMSNQVMTNTGN